MIIYLLYRAREPQAGTVLCCKAQSIIYRTGSGQAIGKEYSDGLSGLPSALQKRCILPSRFSEAVNRLIRLRPTTPI